MDRFLNRVSIVFAGAALWLLAGCGSPEWVRTMNDSSNWRGTPSQQTEEKKRQEYVESHARKPMRWLLSHCVNSGMTYDQVCNVMGENGEREPHDRVFKTTGDYFLDDEMYSWKDNEGRAIYLGFREGRLVNFDPAEFR